MLTTGAPHSSTDGQALVQRQLLLQRVGVFADPPAAGAGQVAGVQRFEHQHQRKPPLARQLLLQQIAGQRAGEGKGKTHEQGPGVRDQDRIGKYSGIRKAPRLRRGGLLVAIGCSVAQRARASRGK